MEVQQKANNAPSFHVRKRAFVAGLANTNTGRVPQTPSAGLGSFLDGRGPKKRDLSYLLYRIAWCRIVTILQCLWHL